MANYESNNLGWQWRQLTQRLGEWLEWQLRQGQPRNAQTEPALMWLAPYLTWFLGILLLGLLSWLLVKSVQRWRTQRLAQRLAQTNETQVMAPSIGSNEWQRRAQKLQRQGNLTAAARALYFALLENLHDRQIIAEKLSRTDREYMDMTQQLADAAAFATILQTHEQIEFAGNEVSALTFEQCQQAYSATQRAIAQAASTQSPARSSHQGRRWFGRRK